MKQVKLTAVSLQRLFLAGIFVLIIAAIFGFTALTKVLQNKAIEVNHAQADADIGSNNVKELEQLNNDLQTHKDVVQRAKQIVAESKSYQYQNQIVQDINSFANSAGITILGYNFSDDANSNSSSPGGSSPSSSSPPVSSPGGSGQSPSVPEPHAASNIPAGVQAVTANITLKNPVPYTNFLRFLKLIEGNVTKMQVTGVSLSPDNGHSDQISNPTIGLIVYTR